MKKIYAKLLAVLMMTAMVMGVFGSIPAEAKEEAKTISTPKVSTKTIKNATGAKIVIGKNKEAEGYEVYVKCSPASDAFEGYCNGRPAFRKFIEQNGKKKRTLTYKNLQPGTYTVKVRSWNTKKYGKKIYSSWSSEKKFTLKEGKAKGSNLVYDFSEIKKGDIIKFGAYEQDGDYTNGKEPIEWVVLDIEGNKALMFSKVALEKLPYDNTYKTLWEKSSIRKWLNGDFIKNSFNNIEEQVILTTEIKNPAHSDTMDRMFLLSEEDVQNSEYGFPGFSDTPNENLIDDKHGAWWLLSLYDEDDEDCPEIECARCVYSNGQIGYYDADDPGEYITYDSYITDLEEEYGGNWYDDQDDYDEDDYFDDDEYDLDIDYHADFLGVRPAFYLDLGDDVDISEADDYYAFSASLENENMELTEEFDIEGEGALWLRYSHDYIDDSSCYWKCRLYNSDDELMTEIKWSGNEKGIVDTRRIGLGTGTYYLVISKGDKFSDGEFKISINFDETQVWEVEFNDSAKTATAVSLNSEIHGSLMADTDVDWYSFELEKKGDVVLDFANAKSDKAKNYWDAYIYDASEKELSLTHFKGDSADYEHSEKLSLNPGKYYVCVKKGTKHSVRQYYFKVNFEG